MILIDYISYVLKILAYRGNCWILVINACRSLWNALTVLRHYLDGESSPTGTLK